MLSDQASRRILTILALGVMSHGIAQSIMFAVMPPLGRELGFQEFQIGGIISASALVFVVCSRLWGRLSDRVGRKPILIVGLAGSALGSLALAVLFHLGLSGAWIGMSLYAAIMLTRMTQSTIMSATHPSATAYVADVTSPARRTAGMSKIGAAFSLASIMGPAIAGLLAGFSLLLPIFFGAFIATASAFMIWTTLPASPGLQAHEANRRVSYFDHRLRHILTLGILVFLGFSVVQQTLAFRLQDTMALDARATARIYGFMMMISASMSLLVQTILVPRLTGSPLWLLRAGTPLLMLALLALIIGQGVVQVGVAMALLGLAMGCTGPGFSASISLAVKPEEQGGAAGIAASVPGLGFILGPLVGTGLYQVEPHLPYIVTALALLPGCVLAFRLRPVSH